VKYIAEADRNFDSYDIAELISEVNVSSIIENGTLLSANCKPFNGMVTRSGWMLLLPETNRATIHLKRRI
jgi:hypothetical protein